MVRNQVPVSSSTITRINTEPVSYTHLQVNADGSGLSQVKTQDSCQPVFQPDDFQGTPTSAIRAYQNQSDGVYTYILTDSNKDGAAHYYESKRAVSLKDGAVKGFFLGYRNTEYDENGQEQVRCV